MYNVDIATPISSWDCPSGHDEPMDSILGADHDFGKLDAPYWSRQMQLCLDWGLFENVRVVVVPEEKEWEETEKHHESNEPYELRSPANLCAYKQTLHNSTGSTTVPESISIVIQLL